MTEKEKQLILERLRVEAEIRSQLGPPARKYGWLQSPLSLLVAGFLLTGLLVPLLQFSQETLKWKRQNRYDNTKYQLSMMRDCLKEFVFLWALAAEAYQQSQTVDSAAAKNFNEKFVELENRRYEQNAKIVSLMLYFPQHQELSKEFNEFLSKYQDFNNLLKYTAERRPTRMSQGSESATPSAADQGSRDLDNSLMTLDEVYQILSGEMRRQIAEMEHDNEQFR